MREFDSSKLEYNVDEVASVGRGSRRFVIPAFDESSQLVAVECFSIHGGVKKNSQVAKKMKEETEILKLANHPFVVDVYGWVKWPGATGIVMEYLSGGNLSELLEDDLELGMFLKLRFCKEVASGLSFIHNATPDKRIIHGDIKAENILLTEELHCKIGDFGSSRIASYTGGLTTTGTEEDRNEFTFFYAAPEVLENASRKLKPSNDTYSYSILVYVILNGEVPIKPQHRELYVLGVTLRQQRPDLESIFSMRKKFEEKNQKDDAKIMNTLIDIMQSCWKQNPSERLKMDKVSKQLASLFLPPEEMEKQVTAAIRGMEFSKPSRDPSKRRPFNGLQFSMSHTSSIDERQDASSSFSSAVLPSENFSSPQRQMSTKGYQDFCKRLKAIDIFLQAERNDEAIDQCKALLSHDASLIPDEDGLLTNETFFLATRFQYVDLISSVRMVQFTLEMCETLVDSEMKISHIVACLNCIKNVSRALYEEGNKNAIKEHCLPGLKLCYEKLEATPNEEDKEKERQKTMCLLQIGQTNCYIERYEDAKAASESCLSIMKEAYRNDAKDYRVYALSFELKADCSRALGIEEAKVLYKEAINMMKSANDVKDKNKKEWIKNVVEAIEKPHTSDRVWKYI